MFKNQARVKYVGPDRVDVLNDEVLTVVAHIFVGHELVYETRRYNGVKVSISDELLDLLPEENECVPTPSMVQHPSHYNTGKFEVIDVVEDWKLNFNLGNVLKYVGRADHKGCDIQDLEKALFYLKRELDNRNHG